MPDVAALLAFALAAVLLIVVPGPSVLFVVGRGLAHGRRVGVLSAVGNALGALVLVVVVAAGLGALVARFGALLTAAKLLGAAYLIYLGVQTIRHRRTLLPADHAVPSAATGALRAAADGFIVGATNPKTLVFFLAALPQFTDPASGPVGPQLLVFGVLFNVIALTSDSCYALLAGGVRRTLLLKPRRMEIAGAASGVAMIGLGAHFALTGRQAP